MAATRAERPRVTASFREGGSANPPECACVHDELRTLLDETIRSHCTRRVNVAWHRVNGPALFQRLRRCDERSTVQTRFHDKNAVAPAGYDPVAHRESLPVWFNFHRKFGHDRAISCSDLFGKSS